jgi:hypothetical protein
MNISVVINTYNRAPSLAQTLLALRYQTYRPFEVVVVNGPSTDDTEQVLARFGEGLKVVYCPELNLGRARNAGVALASGAVVAFLDDDAVPDPHWLEALATGYDSDRVAAVGGSVHYGSGLAPEAGSAATARARNGQPYPNLQPPFWGYTLPRPDRFLHLPGTNVSFRRRCLEEIGGFDEEIEFHLGEADACLRLVDLGYELRLAAGAVVYHKALPNGLRGPHGLRQPRPVIKNRTYFAMRARPADVSVEVLQDHCDQVAQGMMGEARAQGALSADELAAFEEEVDRGLWLGIARGLHGPRKLATIPAARPEQFRAFPALSPAPHPLTLGFVCREAPPEDGYAAAPFTWELARGLAARGHEIHYLTHSPDHERLEFEEGVWVHRLVPEPDGPWCPPGLSPEVKEKLAHAAAVHRAVRSLGQSRHLDLVSVPLRDCEGLYCLLDDELTCVLTVQAPPQPDADPSPMRALEQLALRSARHVHALGPSALDEVRREHGCPAAGVDGFVASPQGGEPSAEAVLERVLGAYTEIINRRKAA